MKCFYCLVNKSYLTLLIPMDYSPPGFSTHEFLRQEYWSGSPFPSPRNLPDPGIDPTSPALAGGFFATESPGKPPKYSHTPGLGWENHIPLKNKRTVQNGRKDPETSCCKSPVVWKTLLGKNV